MNWLKRLLGFKEKPEPKKEDTKRKVHAYSTPISTGQKEDASYTDATNLLNPLNPLSPISPFWVGNNQYDDLPASTTIHSPTHDYTPPSHDYTPSHDYSSPSSDSSYTSSSDSSSYSSSSDSSSYDSGSSYSGGGGDW